VRGAIGTAAPFTATAAVLSFDGAAVELLAVGDEATTLMPRVQGLSLRQALEVLAPLDVRLEVTGRGIVVSQAPPPGAPLPAGAMCRLALASPAARP